MNSHDVSPASSTNQDDVGIRSITDRDRTNATDASLVDLIRTSGPESETAALFRQTLMQYGTGTLYSMGIKGTLLSTVRQRVNIPTPQLNLPRAELTSMIFETVTRAVEQFMGTFIFGEERWVPGEASLRTTFINSCLFAFASVYRRFWREEESRRREISVGTVDSLENLPHPVWTAAVANPERVALNRQELREMLSFVDPLHREMLYKIADGYTHAETARLLGLNVSQVSSAVRRARARLLEIRSREETNEVVSEVEVTGSAVAAVEIVWSRLRHWGINSQDEVVAAIQVVDRCRAMYESPSRPALRRPLKNVDRNLLDIILDEMRVEVPPGDRAKWTANSARVCRDVISHIQKVLPSAGRPAGHRKGIVEDLQELYRCAKLATHIDTQR